MQGQDEAYRLNILNRYRAADIDKDPVLDELTRLAATLFQRPISLVTLISADEQILIARHGYNARRTPRDIAFCNHTIQQQGVMVVENARQDRRFRHNPLVTDEPGIAFYAGTPLHVKEGVNLGALCIIDNKPGTLSLQQAGLLQNLGRSAVTQLELQRANRELLATDQSMIPCCAWCGKIKATTAAGERWLAPQDFIATYAKITHGICPECSDDPALFDGNLE